MNWDMQLSCGQVGDVAIISAWVHKKFKVAARNNWGYCCFALPQEDAEKSPEWMVELSQHLYTKLNALVYLSLNARCNLGSVVVTVHYTTAGAAKRPPVPKVDVSGSFEPLKIELALEYPGLNKRRVGNVTGIYGQALVQSQELLGDMHHVTFLSLIDEYTLVNSLPSAWADGVTKFVINAWRKDQLVLAGEKTDRGIVYHRAPKEPLSIPTPSAAESDSKPAVRARERQQKSRSEKRARHTEFIKKRAQARKLLIASHRCHRHHPTLVTEIQPLGGAMLYRVGGCNGCYKRVAAKNLDAALNQGKMPSKNGIGACELFAGWHIGPANVEIGDVMVSVS